MITVEVEGKNIADLWALACVKQIAKDKDGNPSVKIACKKRKEAGMYEYDHAHIGDLIDIESQQSETGRVIKDLPF